MESISVEAQWERIPMNMLCNGLLVKLRAIEIAIRNNKHDFYSAVYRHLDLPYDVKRILAIHPEQNNKFSVWDDLFKRTSISFIWEDYLLNRCVFLCKEVEKLE